MIDSMVLSFLCGAAFIGGAMTVLVCVAVIVQIKDSKGRAEVRDQWERQLELLARQVGVLESIECAIKDT